MSKKFIFILIILILIVAAAVVFFQLIYLPKESFAEKEVVFRVDRGQGSKEIALNLEKNDLIKNKTAFRVYVLLKGTARNLKAGEYLLSSSMNVPEISDKLFLGETIKETITIIEGWKLKEIGSYFEDRSMFLAREVGQIAEKDFSEDFGFLEDKPKNLSLEGYLFPDSYELTKGESLESVIKKMLTNFNRKLTSDLREEIEKQDKSIFEIVTMASLIEKEVRTFEDKKLVSGILWKRLQVNMPLQVDATIAYVLEGEKWSFDQMRKEIALAREIDSSYNTYKYQGLPLGPIANPGLESIIAAVYPEDSEYWYYLSTPEGETIFSKNLQEHNKAKAIHF